MRTLLKQTFRIFNEGYENFNLKPTISSEVGFLQLKLNYPDGKNMNVSRKKIRVEITFVSEKPMSFTTKIELVDENSRQYSIPVSGTADNCIFTNYSYIQRFGSDFQIRAEEFGPLTLVL